MKSTCRLFINIGFFLVKSTGSLKSTGTWNQPEAWNQPERDEISWNLFINRLGVDCSMWLTSNHIFFGWFWEKNQPSVFNKILKSPSLCSGWFQNFVKNLGLIFSQITLKKHVITSTNKPKYTNVSYTTLFGPHITNNPYQPFGTPYY